MHKYKKHLIVLLILTLISLIVFLPYLSQSRIFMFSADQQLQYNYFYKQWQRMINNLISHKTLPFYSFNTYLGNNFYASKLYYLTGDIFMPFLMLFKNIEIGLMWQTIILVILSGFNFSLFLRGFGLKRESIIITSAIIYGFSGIASIYVGQYMFHRFYAFLPLLFLSIEWYNRQKKLLPFALVVFLLALTNYYFLFPTCIFMVIYYFFTNYYHGKQFNIIKLLLSALPLILSFFIGLLLAGILLIPGIIYILQNERIGNSSFKVIYELKVYIGFIINYISAPLTLFSDYGYMFNSGHNGHLTWYSIYNGAISAPVIFSLFIKKISNRKDKALIITYIILISAAFIPALSSVFHGFSESSMRWLFLISFFNNLIIAISLTHFENNVEAFIKGSFIYLITALSALTLLFLTNFKEFSVSHFLTIVFSFIIFIIIIYLIRKRRLKYLLILTGIELPLMMALHLYILNSTYYFYVPTLDEKALQYYSDIDEDKFYRIYVDPNELLPTSSLNFNQGINMNFNTTITYDTTIEPQLNEFNRLNGYGWHLVNINKPDVLKMLGVKYYLSADETKLPFKNISYYNNVNHLKMYKINDYLPIGFTYSKFKNRVNTVLNDEGVVIDHDLDFLNELLVSEELYSLISDINESERINFELIEKFSDNHLYGHIKNDSRQMLFFSIPYNKGWHLYDNGSKMETYNVQGGFIGVVLEPGDHYITLQFTPVGFKYGAYGSIMGFIGVLLLLWHDYKNEKKPSA